MYANKIRSIGRPMIKTKGKRSVVDVAERIQFLFYKQNNYSILLSNETRNASRESWSRSFLADIGETGDKNRKVT